MTLAIWKAISRFSRSIRESRHKRQHSEILWLEYKLKLLDDDINTLYDKYAEAVASSFTGGIKNG